jgi:hypothetical protein
MDWKLFAQLVVTFCVAVLGWWVGHALSSRRDLANDRRKLRVSYLLEAYRRLEAGSNRSNAESHRAQLESAIADVQLLGSPTQVKMARTFAREMAHHSEASLDEILADLRRSLRDELQLESVDESIIFLRFEDETQQIVGPERGERLSRLD